jgi:glycosyltransferase involved in cell wall biosynthesis
VNTRLALAIPAYSRAVVLRSNLEAMLPELRETETQVFVCDDSKDDLTRATIAQFTERHPHTHYVHNQPGLGHDLNCLRTLALPNTDYVWYLSDATRIHPGGLKRVLSAIANDSPDFLAVTSEKRRQIELPTGKYAEPLQVIESLAWHLTMTGATIYNRRFLHDMHAQYKHFVGTNFIQLGVVLQNLPFSTGGLCWINENWVEAHRDKGESYWEKTTLKVFMKDWADFIALLPDTYSMAMKHRIIRSHSRMTGVLEWRALTRLHAQGLLGPEEFRLYRRYWKVVTGVPAFLVRALTLWPSAPRRAGRQ